MFVRARAGQFDAVLTMFHDQGQIAMKLIGFDQGVTLLGGFPFPISTPAHGTAYDIAGKGIANIGASRNAVLLAARMGREAADVGGRGLRVSLADAASRRLRLGAEAHRSLTLAEPAPMRIVTSLPIADAHHHIWDLALKAHPWLRDEPMPRFRYGDISAIRKTYLPADYRRDSRSFNVVKTVYVEAEWDSSNPIGESRWVHEMAARHGLPNAMVAQSRLDRDDAADVLKQQAAFPLVKSVRHKPKSATRRSDARRGVPGSMDCPQWRKGFALLANHEPPLRPADPLVALRCCIGSCSRFSWHHHYRQPHGSASRPQPRRPLRLEERNGAAGRPGKRRAENLGPRCAGTPLDGGTAGAGGA